MGLIWRQGERQGFAPPVSGDVGLAIEASMQAVRCFTITSAHKESPFGSVPLPLKKGLSVAELRLADEELGCGPLGAESGRGNSPFRSIQVLPYGASGKLPIWFVAERAVGVLPFSRTASISAPIPILHHGEMLTAT